MRNCGKRRLQMMEESDAVSADAGSVRGASEGAYRMVRRGMVRYRMVQLLNDAGDEWCGEGWCGDEALSHHGAVYLCGAARTVSPATATSSMQA